MSRGSSASRSGWTSSPPGRFYSAPRASAFAGVLGVFIGGQRYDGYDGYDRYDGYDGYDRCDGCDGCDGYGRYPFTALVTSRW